MLVSGLGLTVLVNGQPTREYSTDGKFYIPGRRCAPYTLRLTNRTGGRVKAVVSVDGLSVMDGKPAGRDGPGYIIGPWGAIDVPGWRLSDDDVARFEFGEPEKSYATSKGGEANIGVIAAAFFSEKEVIRTTSLSPLGDADAGAIPKSPKPRGPGVWLNESKPQGPSVLRSMSGSLGTGFGSRTEHVVRRVEFDCSGEPPTVLTIHYEDAAILRGLGFSVDDAQADLHNPNPFPADANYCHPPAGWRG